ncbi:MAG: bL21 family ribosomal protein, partial [Oligoflexia bacterium]|nr:bL21 family ribosomal protein [Oligoflexia bacterium]
DIPVLAFGSENNMICDSSQLKKSKVKAILLRQSLAHKIIVFKKKRRKGYRRTQGHRQKITELKILELQSPDGKVSKVEHKSADKKSKSKAGQSVSKKKAGGIKTTAAQKSLKTEKKTNAIKAVKAQTRAKKSTVKSKTQKSVTTKKKQTKKGD